MARTLFIVDDDLLKTLPDVTRDKMKVELKDIYSFVPKFIAVLTLPKVFPERLDFTDSVVKIVKSGDMLAEATTRAKTQQMRSLGSQIQKAKLPVKVPEVKREAAVVERGGLGWHAKDVLAVAGKKVAIVQTGGIVALDFIKTEVMTKTAPNGWTADEAKARSNKLRTQAQLSHGDEGKKRLAEADEVLKKSKAHWVLLENPIKDWPRPLQEAAGVALARTIAHEARHQYVVGHADGGGLGGESAEIYGLDTTARFIPEDQRLIAAAMVRLEAAQARAGIHLKTLPSDQPFAFS